MITITDDIAETFGVLLGDGCVFRYGPPSSQSNGISFTAHESEFLYYHDFIKPTLERAFKVRGRLFIRDDHTTRYRIYSKRLVDFLVGVGIPYGKRMDACIPVVVKRSGLVVPFIRGLYHAEGSIYRRYSKRYPGHARVYSNLLVIQIRMKLKTLMTQVEHELRNLGIQLNRLTEKDGVYTLRVTRQDMIKKFMEIIQPRFKTSPHPTRL